MGRSSVGNYERRSGPTSEFLAALVQAYPNFDVHYLLTGTTVRASAWDVAGGEPYLDPEEEGDEVRALIERLVAAPYANPSIFLTPSEMTTAERITYNMAARAALRTIARALCNDPRRFGPQERR